MVAQQFLAVLARDWDGALAALKEHLGEGGRERTVSPRNLRTPELEGETAMKTPPIVTEQEWEVALDGGIDRLDVDSVYSTRLR